MPVILGEKTEKLRDQLTARGLKNGPEFEFFVLLNMGIFQPAILVYQRVLIFRNDTPGMPSVLSV